MEENNSNSKITLQKNSISFKCRLLRNIQQSLKCFKCYYLGGALETKWYVNVFIHFKSPNLGKNHKKIDISLRVISRTILLTTNNEGNLFQPSMMKVHLEEEKF